MGTGDLLDRYQAMSLGSLKRFVTAKTQEDLRLEFKEANDSSFGQRDDRRNLAIALSGFANSDGGLLIWGIATTKDSLGIDCAKELRPISAVGGFLGRLVDLTASAVSPIVDGVQHRVIGRPRGKDTGFVVTLVPASASGPHMAKLGEDRYYKRSGSSFRKMEHFDLEDMFGRRQRPILELKARVRKDASGQVDILFTLVNSGRGLAKAPYLSITVPPPFSWCSFGVDGNCNEGLPRLRHSQFGRLIYGGSLQQVIHPATELEVARIWNDHRPTPSQIPTGEITIEYGVAADGMALETGELRVAIPI